MDYLEVCAEICNQSLVARRNARE
uniref:Uncharacterized protein n=1 Tax=Anguilla anguilla TaxID=7936 RepID=A0A0E9QAA7_ANGAN